MMTKDDLEKQGADIQTQLNELVIELLSKNQMGVKLLTQQELIVLRLKDGDYETDIPEPDPLGTEVIDNAV